MLYSTDDIRIKKLKPLIPPAILMEELPLGEDGSAVVYNARGDVCRCLHAEDDRLLAIVGPCSIHDDKAALEYAGRLDTVRKELARDLLIVMRVYFEKPRTTVGWKGLINDPDLNGSFAINKGLRKARKLLVDLAEMGLPVGCEFLDTIMPQFFADLVSWGAIGARTTESQVHRELASGLSCPMGFKNGTDGNVRIAMDAIGAAAKRHHFLSVTKQSVAAIVATKGNSECHVILRGGSDGPNYGARRVKEISGQLKTAGLNHRMVIDCSHGNSGGDYRRQSAVAADIAEQYRNHSDAIFGVMLESNLIEGSQNREAGEPLTYGQSITDPCIGWNETLNILETLAQAVRNRRAGRMHADGEA